MIEARFFNTTNLDGEVLRHARSSANNQKEFILNLFKVYDYLSPYQAYHIAREIKLPCSLNGIRAAFTNLTQQDGLLVKTEKKVAGDYGRPEHLWRKRDLKAQGELWPSQ